MLFDGAAWNTARDWLAQQAKAAGGLAEVTWASDVHLDDYSNMEQVKPGLPGMAYLKLDADSEWPADLQINVTP